MPKLTYPLHQRYGLFLLCLLLAALIYGVGVYERQRPLPSFAEDPQLLEKVARFRAAMNAKAETERKSNYDRGERRYDRKTYTRDFESFPFDPNIVGEVELRKLGLSKKQAAAFLRYRGDATDRFRLPADLRKLYVLTDAQKDRLEKLAYIDLSAGSESGTVAFASDTASQFGSPTLPARQGHKPPGQADRPVIIDVNRASAEEWQSLDGIGAYRAGQIVKFRESLGGFVSVEQVAETYGLPDSSYRSIVARLTLGEPARRLAINRLSAEELGAHPYLPRRIARIIVRYREHHGPFADAEALAAVRALDAETRSKILPYLDFSQ